MATDDVSSGSESSTALTIESIPPGQGRVGGRTEMGAGVVATIAGLAARQVPGIRSLGRSRLFVLTDRPARGVTAEVGHKEAALDLQVVIDYGTDIRVAAARLREMISRDVDRMAGRKVVEVNLEVVGVQLPEQSPSDQPARRRVE